MTLVILLDHQDGHRIQITLGPDDHERVDAVWESPDRLLVGLQGNSYFTGRTRWCDLDPWHYTELIERNLAKLTALPLVERSDPQNPVMRSMTGLLTAMVRCLEGRCQCFVELLHIVRVHGTAVAFDFTAAMNHAVMPPRRPTGFQVVVNNG